MMPSRGMGAMQKAKVEGLKRGGSVGTKKKKSAKKSGSKPSNPSLYARVKAEAKRKFDVYPSAYANMWASKQQGKGKC